MESPAPGGAAPEYDDVAAAIEGYGLGGSSGAIVPEATEPDQTRGVEAELDLDSLVEDTPYDMTAGAAIEIDQTEAALSVDDEAVDWVQLAAASAAKPAPPPPVLEPLRVESETIEQPVIAHAVEQPIVEHEVVEPSIVDHSIPEREPTGPRAVQEAAPSGQAAEPSAEVVTAQPAVLDPPPAGSSDAATEEPDSTDEAHAPEVSSVRWRRMKRAIRSVRARKDKLRSVSESDSSAVIQVKPPAPPPPAPPAPPPPALELKKPSSGSWLVAPDHAAAFEPVEPLTPTFGAPEPQFPSPAPVYTPPPPAPVLAPPPPPVPLYVPPPALAPAPTEPVFSRTVGSIAPSYEPPPARTTPSLKATPSLAPTPQLTTAKLKAPSPRPRGTRAPDPVLDIYSSSPAAPRASEPTAFPWKLAAAAGVIMVVAIVGGKVYMPAKSAEEATASPASASQAPTTSGAPVARAAAAGVVANIGRLEIETQPAGARILVDGKPAGESPVALDGIAAGRHTVTFVTSSGSVKRTVRIEAGRTTKLDVPIFSGWVGIYAPFVLEVVEGGRVIGTTEEPRILLSPGKHDLTLVNRELGYSSAQTVEIEPGEVKSISIDPRGHVNLNASPWAEVWIDGRKIGDTPIANLQLPLGVRELTFKHPQFGERKVTVTVKGNAPAAISIDMSKP